MAMDMTKRIELEQRGKKPNEVSLFLFILNRNFDRN